MLYNEACVFIFDNSLSYVDKEIRGFLLNRLRNKGATVIIMSNRIESLSCCDRIFSLDEKTMIK
jgi:ABC-type bacteriocin/lantibiotic exporter with double-glycine peptidase domain